MIGTLLKALNVRKFESLQVMLLLGKGFFMGIFLATYQVTAETLFLSNLQEYLKEAILLSGFLGIVTTSLFSFVQNKIRFSRLVIGNLFLIFCVVALIYYFAGIEESAGIENYIVFLMYVLIGPILAVVLLGFWGTFGRLFNLSQSKRIIGGIDIGQLLAAIAILYAIPFLETIIPDTFDYLIICGVSLLVSIMFMIVISFKFDLSRLENLQPKDQSKSSTTIKSLISNKYIRLLSIFLIFSMITFTFVQYSFQEVVAQQYSNETELRNFLAIFQATILVFGLIMQTFVNDKIIGEYGLKVALQILPIIMAFFTVASIIAGLIFGYSIVTSTSFLWFFLFIALSRLFNFSIRDALENPTFKLYFMPLDANIRFNVQTKVEGVVNESARFIAGAIIIGLSFLTFFELIHYSVALLIVLIGYYFITGNLYQEYKNNIRLKLERQQKSLAKVTIEPVQQLVDKLKRSLSDSGKNKVIFSFKLLEKLKPQVIPSSINLLMKHDAPEIREFAQNKMNELKGISISERYIISTNNDFSKENDKQIVSNTDLMDLFNSGDISRNRIFNLAKSDNPDDRQYAAELISNSTGNETISFLVELLSDTNIKVRKTAIKSAQRKFNVEILNSVIQNLDNPTFSVEAQNTLVLIGEKALQTLDSSFYKYGQQTQTMIKIVDVIGRIGGENAINQLWSKIDFPDKIIVSQVLAALSYSGFQADVTQISRIKYAIESDIENIAWNMAAEVEVGNMRDLKKALQYEIEAEINHIYTLLTMLYDKQSIQLVKENIQSGTTEDTIYAIELLDVFLSEDLKQRVIPVLDEITYSEKTKKLEIYYPRERLDNKMVLKFILNRDYSQINRWTKACVIHEIGKKKLVEFKLDLIANIFNPDRLIYQLAAWSLFQLSLEEYEENVNRLNSLKQVELNNLILNANKNFNKLNYNIVLFLEKISAFSDVSNLAIAGVVDIIEIIQLKSGKTLSISNHYNDNFYIVFEGKMNIYENGNVIGNTSKGEFIGELLTSSNYFKSNLIMAIDDSILYKINKDSFYELLSGNNSLAQKIVEYV